MADEHQDPAGTAGAHDHPHTGTGPRDHPLVATGPHGHPGYTADKAALLARLKRIEGQVRGVHRMVATDTYCIDVLTQVSAATRALENVALLLLEDHLSHCVVDAARTGGPESDAKVAEAVAAVARLVRS